jgi:hypothetical protein
VARRAYAGAVEAELIERPIRVPGVPVTIEARWASMSEWYVYDRTATTVRAWLIQTHGVGATVMRYQQRPAYRLTATTPLIEASRQLDTSRHALALFEFAFPEVVDHGDGSVDVLWSDIRFCRPTMCDLRFGGRFDSSGRALEQVVQIGTVRQTRPVGPP